MDTIGLISPTTQAFGDYVSAEYMYWFFATLKEGKTH